MRFCGGGYSQLRIMLQENAPHGLRTRTTPMDYCLRTVHAAKTPTLRTNACSCNEQLGFATLLPAAYPAAAANLPPIFSRGNIAHHNSAYCRHAFPPSACLLHTCLALCSLPGTTNWFMVALPAGSTACLPWLGPGTCLPPDLLNIPHLLQALPMPACPPRKTSLLLQPTHRPTTYFAGCRLAAGAVLGSRLALFMPAF